VAKTSKEVHGDTTVFVLSYTLPELKYLQPSGRGKVIPITAFDSGCGVSSDLSLHIDLDSDSLRTTELQWDPLPDVTSRDSIEVTGQAPHDAVVVYVLRNLSTQGGAIVEPDSATGRFSAVIGLRPGSNKIYFRAEDIAGNSTRIVPTNGISVTRVSAAGLTVQTPYSRQETVQEGKTLEDIMLRDPDGMIDASIRIFNLEGDCVWSEDAGPEVRREFGFHWNGESRAGGERAQQGYYIVRAQWRTASGRLQHTAQGLLLRD
jgi:hypothetical protein